MTPLPHYVRAPNRDNRKVRCPPSKAAPKCWNGFWSGKISELQERLRLINKLVFPRKQRFFPSWAARRRYGFVCLTPPPERNMKGNRKHPEATVFHPFPPLPHMCSSCASESLVPLPTQTHQKMTPPPPKQKRTVWINSTKTDGTGRTNTGNHGNNPIKLRSDPPLIGGRFRTELI